MGVPNLPGDATPGLAVPAKGDDLGADDEHSEEHPGEACSYLFFRNTAVGPQTRLARYDAKISLETGGRIADRERADPGESGALRRSERSTYPLRFDAGGLRLWMQVLRKWFRRVEAQSRRS